MEQSNSEDVLPLNANRSVPREDAAPATSSASVSRAAPTVEPARAALDWRKLWPWAVAVVLLLVIVWLVTRKSGGHAPAVA